MLERDLQSLNPGPRVILFELDVSMIVDGAQPFRFTPMVSDLQEPVVFRGLTYYPQPIEMTGWAVSGRAAPPRPTLRVSNVARTMSTIMVQYDQLVGARLRRIVTFAKYLDSAELADPLATAAEDMWIVDRPTVESPISVEFELSSALDVEGQMIPRRLVLSNSCPFTYEGEIRGLGPGECTYARGGHGDETQMFDVSDAPTLNPLEDKCGKRLRSCTLRFAGTARLPFGGFPGAQRVLR